MYRLLERSGLGQISLLATAARSPRVLAVRGQLGQEQKVRLRGHQDKTVNELEGWGFESWRQQVFFTVKSPLIYLLKLLTCFHDWILHGRQLKIVNNLFYM